MSQRAIFVRHGQSVSNAHPHAAALPAAEGDCLTDHGRKEAGEAIDEVRRREPTEILHSPMGRARETAAVINEALGLPQTELDFIHELRESDHFTEMTPEEQKLRRWSEWMLEHADDPDFSWEGGESFNDVIGRVRRLKAHIEAMPDESRPVVVTHGLFLRFFLFDTLLGDEFDAAHVKLLWNARSLNCGVSIFEHGERWHRADPDLPGWSCITWMSRPLEPVPRV
jgi:broad specificity phosphatase PhoE